MLEDDWEVMCDRGANARDQKDVVFTALNPVTGRGRVLTRLAAATLPGEGVCALDDVCYPWALSQDGKEIAVHGHRNNRFTLISTETGQRRSIEVPGRPLSAPNG